MGVTFIFMSVQEGFYDEKRKMLCGIADHSRNSDGAGKRVRFRDSGIVF